MKKMTFGVSACLVALTVGLATHAKPDPYQPEDRADLDIPAPYYPSREEILSDEAFREILESERTIALPDEENPEFDSLSSSLFTAKKPPAKKHKKPLYHFVYTDKGGVIPLNSGCRLFLDEEGVYGSYGRIIKDYLDEDVKKNGSSIFFSDSILGMTDAPKACPKWKTFDHATKTKFWVWTFTAIAFVESSCRWDVKEKPGSTKGATCSGLLQLEKEYKFRSPRGPNCSGISPADIKKPYGNLRCGMDIMKGVLTSPDKTGEPLFDGRIYPGPGMMVESYWEKLRRVNGGTIGRLSREFKPCGA